MKNLSIQEKLKELNVDIDQICLGDFDVIGEFTAKKQRSNNDPNYHKFGAFFRPNYERGILIYYLIKHYNISSILEIGFGRGYSTFCAAKAFTDFGINGTITTVDPNFDERFIGALQQVFPKEWFGMIQFAKSYSNDVLPQINQKFDLVIIDGDHSFEATKADWLNVKDKFNKVCIFDDYHLPQKNDPGIACRLAIDEINEQEFNCEEKQLILMDRRIFHDDKDQKELDYGQVLLTKTNALQNIIDTSFNWNEV